MDVSVTLGSEIVYVIGTVNGVYVTWVRISHAIWSATVKYASDCTYVVQLTAYDGAGNSKAYTATLHYGIELVFDRSVVDLNRAARLAELSWDDMTAAERAEYTEGPKGFYNATDLNRVERAVEFLCGLLYEYGYTLDSSVKTNWAFTDLPRSADMSRYLGNVQRFRTQYAPFLTGLPSGMGGLTYTGANNIERFLASIYFFIQQMTSAVVMCGEVNSGEAGT